MLDSCRECVALQTSSLGNDGGLGHSLGPTGGGHRSDQLWWRTEAFGVASRFLSYALLPARQSARKASSLGLASLPWSIKGSIVGIPW